MFDTGQTFRWCSYRPCHLSTRGPITQFLIKKYAIQIALSSDGVLHSIWTLNKFKFCFTTCAVNIHLSCSQLAYQIIAISSNQQMKSTTVYITNKIAPYLINKIMHWLALFLNQQCQGPLNTCTIILMRFTLIPILEDKITKILYL